MRKILFSAVFILATTVMMAQEHKVVISPTVGYGGSLWLWGTEYNNINHSGKTYKVGIDVEIPFSKIWSLQTGLNYYSLHSDLNTYYFLDGSSSSRLYIHQNYLDLPILASARIGLNSWLNIQLLLGPYVAYGIGGKGHSKILNDKVSTFGDLGIRRLDAGFKFGANVEAKRFVLGFESRFGLRELVPDMNVYNAAFYVTLGYRMLRF